MLLEDLIGFGLLRTYIDLYRQRIMGKGSTDEHGHQELNIPAARERLLRESLSILTDNVSGGVFAFTMAMLANQAGSKNLSQHFVSDKSLSLFKDIVASLPQDTLKNPKAFESSFLKQLAVELELPEKSLIDAYKAWPEKKFIKDFDGQLAHLIKENKSNAESFNLQSKTKKINVTVHDVLDDSHSLIQRLNQDNVKHSSHSLNEKAKAILERSQRLNKLQYLGIVFALALTFGVPFAIQAMTRKLDGFANYPGDKGIHPMVSTNQTKDKSWFGQHFPYMSDAIHQHKATALLPVIPLLFAFGLFDTQALSRFAFKEAFNAPWKKEFIPRLKEMYQFGKGFPFTTQQQMASCFAFLIFSRMMTARSDVEFRERSVDSLLGWSTWILGTPLLKRGISKVIEKQASNIKLFNSAKGLRGYEEIKHFPLKGETPLMAQKAMNTSRLINFASMLFSIATLGILEPVAAIKWTAHRADKHKETEDAEYNHIFPQQLPRPNPFVNA